jgi:hypothetical protein
MTGRPLLAARVLASTAEQWFGRPLRQIHDADYARWLACQRAARKLLHGDP